MTRYLLDTNIVSDFSRPIPSASLLAWLSAQQDDDLFIASMTVAEIRKGILDLPLGKRRQILESWFVGSAGPKALFPGRVLPFDEDAALEWAALIVEGKTSGRPRHDHRRDSDRESMRRRDRERTRLGWRRHLQPAGASPLTPHCPRGHRAPQSGTPGSR